MYFGLAGRAPYARARRASAARRLVSLFDCCGDETYALTTRRTTPFAHPCTPDASGPELRPDPTRLAAAYHRGGLTHNLVVSSRLQTWTA